MGASTDNGHRLSAEHVWNRVPGLDMRALSKLTLGATTRTWRPNGARPSMSKAGSGSPGCKAERLDVNQSFTGNQQIKLEQGARDRAPGTGAILCSTTDSLTDSLLLRQTNTVQPTGRSASTMRVVTQAVRLMPLPSRGTALAAGVGVGTTLGSERQPYVRARCAGRVCCRWMACGNGCPICPAPRPPGQPAASSASQSRLGRVAMRAEGGAIVSKQQAPVPDSQRFWAGATSRCAATACTSGHCTNRWLWCALAA